MPYQKRHEETTGRSLLPLGQLLSGSLCAWLPAEGSVHSQNPSEGAARNQSPRFYVQK